MRQAVLQLNIPRVESLSIFTSIHLSTTCVWSRLYWFSLLSQTLSIGPNSLHTPNLLILNSDMSTSISPGPSLKLRLVYPITVQSLKQNYIKTYKVPVTQLIQPKVVAGLCCCGEIIICEARFTLLNSE